MDVLALGWTAVYLVVDSFSLLVTDNCVFSLFSSQIAAVLVYTDVSLIQALPFFTECACVSRLPFLVFCGAWDNLEENSLLAFCLFDEEESLLYINVSDMSIYYLSPKRKIANSLDEFLQRLDCEVDYFFRDNTK